MYSSDVSNAGASNSATSGYAALGLTSCRSIPVTIEGFIRYIRWIARMGHW